MNISTYVRYLGENSVIYLAIVTIVTWIGITTEIITRRRVSLKADARSRISARSIFNSTDFTNVTRYPLFLDVPVEVSATKDYNAISKYYVTRVKTSWKSKTQDREGRLGMRETKVSFPTCILRRVININNLTLGVHQWSTKCTRH